jgi:hypothetical protein
MSFANEGTRQAAFKMKADTSVWQCVLRGIACIIPVKENSMLFFAEVSSGKYLHTRYF